MKKINVLLIALFGLLITMTMCKKDEESNPPYVGSWETEAFKMQGTDVKMDFDFAATNFVAEISVMYAPDAFAGFLGVKGDVSEMENQTLDVSLTDIGQWDQDLNAYDYQNRTDDEIAFNTLYEMFLASMLPKDFEAIYVVEGNTLDLIIPVAQDTINLFRK